MYPRLPYVLTCSNDNSIKLWTWEELAAAGDAWHCKQTYTGHSSYVNWLAINPTDDQQFASASSDGTVKLWRIGRNEAEYTLEDSGNPVDSVDFYRAVVGQLASFRNSVSLV